MYLLYIFPLSSTHLWLCCSNFFNQYNSKAPHLRRWYPSYLTMWESQIHSTEHLWKWKLNWGKCLKPCPLCFIFIGLLTSEIWLFKVRPNLWSFCIVQGEVNWLRVALGNESTKRRERAATSPTRLYSVLRAMISAGTCSFVFAGLAPCY
jgi:hypothetical protein